MKIGLSTFPTAESMRPGRLAAEAEARGFESLWFAEHSHIPVERRSAWGGGDTLPDFYYEVLDPVVALADAAAGSTSLRLGFGIALLAQRDLIQFAKSLASLDALSEGRVSVGVGGGWNIEEMENHGTDPSTRFRRMRESVEALRILLSEKEPEYHGRIIDFDPVVMLPKPARCPEFHIAGAAPRGLERAIAYGDGWIPLSGRGDDDFVTLAGDRSRAEEEAGRSIEFTVYAASSDPSVLEDFRDAGIDRALLLLIPGTDEQTIAQLDQYAPLVEHHGRA